MVRCTPYTSQGVVVPKAPQEQSEGRARLNRERVVQAAVALADRDGLDSLSMRHLADRLGVVPMALYKHVAGKEELVDAMVDLIIAEIEAPPAGSGWQEAVRGRILAARAALLAHPWARAAVESRTTTTPAVLDHLNTVAGLMRQGGLSVDLTHHAMHALGSRVWGFTQDLFGAGDPAAPPPGPEQQAMLAQAFPWIAEIAAVVAHDPDSVVGGGCDDQFEFELALDLLLDGIAHLHATGWTSGGQARRSNL